MNESILFVLSESHSSFKNDLCLWCLFSVFKLMGLWARGNKLGNAGTLLLSSFIWSWGFTLLTLLMGGSAINTSAIKYDRLLFSLSWAAGVFLSTSREFPLWGFCLCPHFKHMGFVFLKHWLRPSICISNHATKSVLQPRCCKHGAVTVLCLTCRVHFHLAVCGMMWTSTLSSLFSLPSICECAYTSVC